MSPGATPRCAASQSTRSQNHESDGRIFFAIKHFIYEENKCQYKNETWKLDDVAKGFALRSGRQDTATSSVNLS
jgi:hypothetical protein